MLDMLFAFEQENLNGWGALRQYSEMYPSWRMCDLKIFRNVNARLTETGIFQPERNDAGLPKTLPSQQEVEILGDSTDNTEMSSWDVAAIIWVGKS